MKKYLFIFIILFCDFFYLFASSYKINSVTYNIDGMTKESILKRKVEVDYNIIFPDETAFLNYLNDYKQRLSNTRTFDEIQIDYITTVADENNDLYAVDLTVTLDDTSHFLAVPYPNYNSNSGFKLKIKFKDTNLFGTMQSLSSDLDFALSQDDSDTEMKRLIGNMGLNLGFNLSFDLPFSIKNFPMTWTNSYSFSYTIGHTAPNWNAKTGLYFSVPLAKRASLAFSVAQGFIGNQSYRKFDDYIYFSEYAQVSLPVILQSIENWGNVVYSPYIDATFYWDFNGINKDNSDLLGPAITIGQTISTGRVNWENNLRTGLSLSTTQSFSYNVKKEVIIPKLSVSLQAFKGFKRIGLASNLYFFATVNGTEGVGGRLRGIRDSQNAINTTSALVANLDFPIRIFSTFFKKNRIMRKLNFEVQVSPFIDFALLNNSSTGTTFYLKDGFYAGGFEVIVFPASWKSIQVRGSVGVDIGRLLFKRFLNMDWRDNISKYEISVGIGLHY